MVSNKQLSRFPVHLGRGARIDEEPEFTGEMDWYMTYGERRRSDGLANHRSWLTLRKPLD